MTASSMRVILPTHDKPRFSGYSTEEKLLTKRIKIPVAPYRCKQPVCPRDGDFQPQKRMEGFILATHSDPTAARATGNVQQEWIEMSMLAIQVRRSRNRSWAEAQEKRFTGIFRRLLRDPEEEILSQLPAKVQRKLMAEEKVGA